MPFSTEGSKADRRSSNLRNTDLLGYKRRQSLGRRRAVRQPVSFSTCKSISFLRSGCQTPSPSLLTGIQRAGHTSLSPRHRQLPGAGRTRDGSGSAVGRAVHSGGTAPPEPQQGKQGKADLLREPSGTASKTNQNQKNPKQLSSSVREDEQLLPSPALTPHPGQRHCLSPGG